MTTSATYLRAVGELSQERARIGTRHRLPTAVSGRHEASPLTKSSRGRDPRGEFQSSARTPAIASIADHNSTQSRPPRTARGNLHERSAT